MTVAGDEDSVKPQIINKSNKYLLSVGKHNVHNDQYAYIVVSIVYDSVYCREYIISSSEFHTLSSHTVIPVI